MVHISLTPAEPTGNTRKPLIECRTSGPMESATWVRAVLGLSFE